MVAHPTDYKTLDWLCELGLASDDEQAAVVARQVIARRQALFEESTLEDVREFLSEHPDGGTVQQIAAFYGVQESEIKDVLFSALRHLRRVAERLGWSAEDLASVIRREGNVREGM